MTTTNLRRAAIAAIAMGLGLSACTATPPDSTTNTTQEPQRTVVSASPTTAQWNVAHDTGPLTGATGSVATDARGIPAQYTVASGDTQGVICHRLGLRWWQLKTADGKFLGTYPELAVGEVLLIVDVPESDAIAAGNPDYNALC